LTQTIVKSIRLCERRSEK